MANLPSIGLIVVPQPWISMARFSGGGYRRRRAPLPLGVLRCKGQREVRWNRSQFPDITAGARATSRLTIHTCTGAQCRFRRAYRRGTKTTRRSDHGGRIRFSPKRSGYCFPANVIQRSKHCQTLVLGQTQARVGAHGPPPIGGGHTLYQARRPSAISPRGLCTMHCRCCRGFGGNWLAS